MDWRKPAATALLALVVVLGMTGCPTKPPKTPDAPWGRDSTWTGAIYACSVTTTVPKGNIRYVMDWQDAIDTGDYAAASAETVEVTHEWSTAGTYDVKAQALLDVDPSKASEFSLAKSVKVNPNSAPVVDSVYLPPVAVKDVEINITVYGTDPDDDSLRAIVKWPTGETTTEFSRSPCEFTVSHAFTKVETADIHVRVQDWKGTKSRDTIVRLPVGLEGGVKWSWQGPDEGAMQTSALVANDGTDEVVMSYCWDDYKFYAINVDRGRAKRNATTVWPEYEFVGGPALTAAGNVIVSSDEGELYALTLAGLDRMWRWPNIAPEDSEPFNAFGAPAINGNDIYIGRETDVDTLDRLYKFTDLGTSVTAGPTYALTGFGIVDAPVVDVDGSVYFGTDSGYLIKLDANLAPYWRLPLVTPIGDVRGPIIGSDGTVYCGTDASRLYAINPDGTMKWAAPVELDGIGARPALGQSALFVGTGLGTVYSINPATGTINWQKTLAQGLSFSTTPIVAANGYVYFQNDDDVLYCLNQADGTTIWTCDCNYYLPGGGRSGGSRRAQTLQLYDYDPNPSITSSGDIIVVGQAALFCVAGYAAGPLDGAAAWPKWQKDLSNTGKR